jgi:hypothetical protein
MEWNPANWRFVDDDKTETLQNDPAASRTRDKKMAYSSEEDRRSLTHGKHSSSHLIQKSNGVSKGVYLPRYFHGVGKVSARVGLGSWVCRGVTQLVQHVHPFLYFECAD